MVQFVSNDTLLEKSMNIFDYIPKIDKHPLFKNVSEGVVAKYLCDENIELVSFAPSEIIIPPDSKRVPIFAVASGTVEILSPAENRKVLLKTMGAGSFFGVANLYALNTEFPSTVRAKKQTTLLIIKPKAFMDMLSSEPTLMSNYLEFLSKKIIYLNKKIASYTAKNTENRVAYFLCENEVEGTVSTGMSFSDIAVMLDIGRASLYRAFDKFEDEKLIERNGKTIKILNKENLKNYI